MQTRQTVFARGAWQELQPGRSFAATAAQLVFVFGATAPVQDAGIFNYLQQLYPNAQIVLASTAGEIFDEQVCDECVAATAIHFEHTTVRTCMTNIREQAGSFETGKYLMQQLSAPDLCAVFIISDGTYINGSDLVSGLNAENVRGIPVTGGLAGDADRFEQTVTGLNAPPQQGNVIAIGFYGSQLRVGHGSLGGWDEFGPERAITRSDKNILYEIDGKSALDLYKEYLGDYVYELPGSALLFPLSLSMEGADETLVRTILTIDEQEKSMTFAGNMPEGSRVRLMKSNFDSLIDGSSTAAANAAQAAGGAPGLALLVSCVGRKLVLQERSDEEIQAAREIFGPETCIAGFYSYGELSPFSGGSRCELHNQTMTITSFTEINPS